MEWVGFPMSAVNRQVLRAVIQMLFEIGDQFRSKEVTEHPMVRTAHATYCQLHRSYNPVIARVMRAGAGQLGLRFVEHGPGRTGGARWQRVA